MMEIIGKKIMIKCICDHCGLEEHEIIEGKEVETSYYGTLDFLSLRCKSCLNIVVSQPVPFPDNKSWASVLVDGIQEKVNENS